MCQSLWKLNNIFYGRELKKGRLLLYASIVNDVKNNYINI